MPALDPTLSNRLDTLGGPDTLDDIAIHGVLVAAALTPTGPSDRELLTAVLGEDLSEVPASDQASLGASLVDTVHAIDMTLAGDDDLVLPFRPTLNWEDSAMQSWCVGFMTWFLDHEARFNVETERLAELLLPIQTGSGLFTDEPEFRPLYEDQALLGSLVEQIPDILVDFYLACRVE